jgi:predicted peptidase
MAPNLPQGSLQLDQIFEARLHENGAGEKLPYRLLRPSAEEPGKKYPLVLCLHGMGERGEDNLRQLAHGVRRFAEPEIRERFPAWVVVPQCPGNERWVEAPRSSAGGYDRPKEISRPLRLCREVVSTLEKEEAVDSQRLYVLGLSMGGFGTWDLISRYPGLFAAAVPICGGGDEALAPFLLKTAIWAFHGGKDEVVSPEYSRRMIRAIERAGGSPSYTEYPDVGHNSWDPALAEPQLFSWLFSQALGR